MESFILAIVFSFLSIFLYFRRSFYSILFMAALSLVYFLMPYFQYSLIVGLMFAIFTFFEQSKNKKKEYKREFKRDKVHLALGIIAIICIYLDKVIFPFLVSLAFLLLFIINYLGKPKIAFELERRNERFGIGAIFLASGSLILLALIKNPNFLISSSFALLISDPIATLFGAKSNGKKSNQGSLAFFVSLLIPSCFLLGYLGIIFSLALTLAERFSPIDDNLFIPLISLLIYFLIP